MRHIPKNFKITIGGDYYIDCPNTITAHGECLFRLQRRDSDGKLMVDFDVYEASGRKIATIKNNRVMRGDRNAYQIENYPAAKESGDIYRVRERRTGRIVCEIKQRPYAEDECELEVCADLYTKKGLHLVLQPGLRKIGDFTMQGASMTFHGGLIIQ